jgi:hydroxypyruvate isomerase
MSTASTRPVTTSDAWCLRYASHLGYRSPESPLFPYSARDPGPSAQVDIAADLGLAGVQYALARGSSPVEQTAVADRLQHHGLVTGCMLYAPFEVIRKPYLGRSSVASRVEFLEQIRAALEVSRRIDSSQIVVLAAADPEIPHGMQMEALVDHLRYAAELAQRAGVVLELEGVSSSVLPPMILQRLDDILEVIRRVESPNVRLIYDTAHVQALDGDAAVHLDRVFEYIDIVQIADHPGRFEPGTGNIDFEAILTGLARRGYSGLVELEHSWSKPGVAAERQGLDDLRILDARVRQRVKQLSDVATEELARGSSPRNRPV